MLVEKKLTKRQIKAQETKKKLLESAITLFAVHGFDRVTIEDITYNAGTSKGAFYSHFKSKQDVVLERFRQLDEANYQFYDEAIQKDTAIEQLVAYMGAVCDYTMNVLGMDLVSVAYINQVSSKYRSTFFMDEKRPAFFLLENLIKQGQKKGEIRKDLTSMYLVNMITRLFSSWAYEWCVHGGNFNLTKEMQKHLLLVHPVLKPQ